MKSALLSTIAALVLASGVCLPFVCSAQNLHDEAAVPASVVSTYKEATTVAELRGNTQNAAGAPLSDVRIVIRCIDDHTNRTLASDGRGTFVVDGLKPGRYELTASKKGFVSPKPSTLEVAARESLLLDVTLGDSVATASVRQVSSETRPSAPPADEMDTDPLVHRGAKAHANDQDQPELLALNSDAPDANATNPGPTTAAAPTTAPAAAAATSAEVTEAVQKELQTMEARIAELEAQLKNRGMPEEPASSTPAVSSAPTGSPAASALAAAQVQTASSTAAAAAAAPAAAPAAATFEPQKQTLADPFSYADYTWLNGNSRNKDTPLATKYFTPEVRFDTNFMEDYNQPRDHTMGGSTESFRSGEVQLEQMSFGGDIHVDNVRGRVLTMFGLFATTTPRNDGSAGVGQWNLNDAYKYFSEAWGGYHFNVNHGLNIDAGIFVSYIGLFSYYNFDNWTYQPSYVSSNTPWFFNGLRIQWFPTEKLKIEPWIINGWQSYAKYNGSRGLGGQILWRPTPYLSMVFNNYGNGTDTLGVPGRSRIHTDDSLEMKYFDHPDSYGLDKMAFSVTGDLGCEYGGGVSCHNDSHGHPKQMFAGWMLYNRFWFHKDLFAATLGGGVLDNPGRYLTLLPPINGATAVSGSPYFPSYPGSIYKGWDSTVTFDYMPSQFITFRFETGYRYANVPYWSGRGGITPPGGNVAPVASNGSVGTGGSYICTNGSTSVVAPLPLSGYSGQGLPVDNASGAVTAACTSLDSSPTLGGSGPWTLWQPDLRKDQWVNTIAIMVKW
jgi:Putative beta-barrel porin-2, OmpL-like. bbp2/Carboxypeptidase regulatory-like domain